jgi:hypothetical protein
MEDLTAPRDLTGGNDLSHATDVSDDPDELDRLADRLHPDVNRAQILDRFEHAFRSGTVPEPPPDGFLPGRFLATSIWSPFDSLALRLARVWMPWEGKSFDPASASGVNRFTQAPLTRAAFNIVFPGYQPIRSTADRIDGFAFRTWIGRGQVDPGVDVLKIDYDSDQNPSFIIRRILDELVQIAPGRYLGRVLLRVGGRFHPIGFFSLRTP